jgi:hypothetical protein
MWDAHGLPWIPKHDVSARQLKPESFDYIFPSPIRLLDVLNFELATISHK